MTNPRQKFDNVDVLRLEVEKATTGLVNLVQNPNGAGGGYGWVTPVPGSYIYGSGGFIQYITAAAAGGNLFSTEMAPVTVGQYVGARWHMAYAPWGSHRARLRFWTADKVSVHSNGPWSTFTTTPVIGTIAATVVPSGAAYVEIQFEIGGPSNSYPLTTASSYAALNDVVLAKAATAVALGTTRVNLLVNPSFENDTTGWQTPAPAYGTFARTAATGAPHGSNVCTVTAGPGATPGVKRLIFGTVNGLNVNPGYDYTLTYSSKAVTTPRPITGRIYWYDGANNFIRRANIAGGLNTTTGWTTYSGVATAPGNAQTCRIELEIDAAYGEQHQFDAFMFELGWAIGRPFIVGTANNQFLGVVDYAYANIIAPAHEIKIKREGLNLGTLNATVLDTTLDPTVSSTIRPGRRCRLLALSGTTWEPLYTGRIANADVAYDQSSSDPNKVSRVSITTTDNTSPLANATRPSGVANISDLPYVLEGAGVPWNVNGNGNQVPTASVVSNNDNASALDQIALTRDSKSGYAWVDRHNILQAWDAAQMPSGANLIPNPSFESALTNTWNGVSATLTRDTTTVKDGTYSLKATASSTSAYGASTTAGGPAIAVKGGQPYTLSYWYRSAHTGRQVTGFVSWLDSLGSSLGTTTLPVVTVPASMTGFAEIVTTLTPPINASRMALELRVSANAAGEVIYFDKVTMAATAAIVDESAYSSLEVAFSTKDCINEVVVKNIEWDPADPTKSVEVTYGPYRDETSITEWGRYAAEFTTHGLNSAGVAALGARVLARNATPTVRINSVTVPILKRTDLTSGRALIDLYDRAIVSHAAKQLTGEARVTGVEHTITNTGWLMHLTFSDANGVASPQQTPPVQSSGSAGSWVLVSSFTNGWTNYGGVYVPARYCRRDGIVHLQVAIKSGTVGATAFTLPPGFRPGYTLTAPGADGSFEISSAGAVAYYGASNAVARLAYSYPADN